MEFFTVYSSLRNGCCTLILLSRIERYPWYHNTKEKLLMIKYIWKNPHEIFYKVHWWYNFVKIRKEDSGSRLKSDSDFTVPRACEFGASFSFDLEPGWLISKSFPGLWLRDADSSDLRALQILSARKPMCFCIAHSYLAYVWNINYLLAGLLRAPKWDQQERDTNKAQSSDWVFYSRVTDSKRMACLSPVSFLASVSVAGGLSQTRSGS